MADTFLQKMDYYLKRHAGQPRTVEMRPRLFTDTIVVVPALAEAENVINLMRSLEDQNPEDMQNTLVLFVVNNSCSANDDIRDDNKRTIHFLRQKISAESAPPYTTAGGRLRVGLIDCATVGNCFNDREAGVGLARKTGLDAALNLFSDYRPGNLLICLDADCLVPENYLSVLRATMKLNNYNAAAVQYEHRLPEDDDENLRAIICYELFLRHYSLGLRFTGSPYSFHSVGSTMAFTAQTYIKAQGMNKLKAGEDFYFLQKVAKFTPIAIINRTRVYPSPRQSLRVPFGTGQRVTRYLLNGSSEYRVHDPRTFLILKNWLSFFKDNTMLPGADLLAAAAEISTALARFLEGQKFIAEWDKIRLHSGNLLKQADFWFDGFKIMKCLHFLRDNGYDDVNTFDGIDQLLIMAGIENCITRTEALPGLDTQLKYLELMRLTGEC